MIQRKKINRQTLVILGFFICILFIVTAGVGCLFGQSGKVQDEKYSSNRLLVRFNPNTSIAVTNKILSSVNGTIVRTYSTPGLNLVELDGGMAIGDAISLLEGNPNILYAEPDYSVHKTVTNPKIVKDQKTSP